MGETSKKILRWTPSLLVAGLLWYITKQPYFVCLSCVWTFNYCVNKIKGKEIC
jgi:hypothetical protein